MAEQRKGSAEEHSNRLRFSRLIRVLGTDVLRELFCSRVKPVDLENVLKKSKKKIKANKQFKNPQLDRLFPGTVTPDVNDFDISLLALLLRYLPECKMNRSAACWGWNDTDIDRVHQSKESHIMRIKNMRNKDSHGKPFLPTVEFEKCWKEAEMAMLALGGTIIPELHKMIAEMKTKPLDAMSPQLKSLLSNSRTFFEEYSGDYVVKTSTLQNAMEILETHHMIVLTGQPGEGKTTTAASLAREMYNLDRCLIISSPDDWRQINLDDRTVDAVIVDDIFGSGALKQRRVDQWLPILREMERAAKKTLIDIIITTRAYILQNVKDTEANTPIVESKDTTLCLESKNLTNNEKAAMLRNHAKLRGRTETIDMIIKDCIEMSSSFYEGSQFGFQFGFPECVDMFVKNDGLFGKGSTFFRNPNEFFKKCLQELFTSEDEEKRQNFLALVTVWANDGKVTQKELDLTSEKESEKVKRVSEKFGFEFKPTIKIRLQTALKQHMGGFLTYSDQKKEFRFSHNVIGDMVGIVISERYPKQTIEFCGRDFLLEYVTVDTKTKEYCVPVPEELYPLLVEKCIQMILRTDSHFFSDKLDFSQLQRIGQRENKITPKDDLDVSIIRHEAFQNKHFVRLFLDAFDKNEDLASQMFRTPVMSMSGFLFDYGIDFEKEQTMCLSAYSIYIGSRVLFEGILSRKMVNEDLQFSLMLAVHSNRVDIMNLLLQAGVKPNGNAIYIAMHKSNTYFLISLLDCPNVNINDRGNLVKGNYPIIIATRKGFYEAVKMLVGRGADLAVKNKDKMTALDKAIIYKHTEICQLLIKHGAPLDLKHGKFRRTPLHVAADMGQLEVVKMLMKKGSPVNKRDHKGHYPVHCAAIRGHVEVVRELLQHGKHQEKFRITSYQKRSPLKGMTVFHVALWKKNMNLLEALIELQINPNVQDWYGQTPLQKAVLSKMTEFAGKLIEMPITDVNLSDKNGFAPLHSAIYTEDAALVEKLCKKADVNKSDKYGKTPLHIACQRIQPKFVAHILQKGGDTRMLTKRQDSVLHITRRLMTQKSRKLNADERRRLDEIERLILQHDPTILEFLRNKKNRRGQEVTAPLATARFGSQHATSFDSLLQQLQQLRFNEPGAASASFGFDFDDIQEESDDEYDLYDDIDDYQNDDYDDFLDY